MTAFSEAYTPGDHLTAGDAYEAALFNHKLALDGVRRQRHLALASDLARFRDGSSPLSVPEQPESPKVEESPKLVEDQPILSEAERLAQSTRENSQKNGPSSYGTIR